MPRPTKQEPERGDARTRLLEAGRDVIRAQGYSATTVDDLCKAAGVTKGAFFHHFASKEALAIAAAGYWSDTTGAFFAGASPASAFAAGGGPEPPRAPAGGESDGGGVDASDQP